MHLKKHIRPFLPLGYIPPYTLPVTLANVHLFFLCKECRRKCFKQTRKIPEHMDIMYNLYMEVSTAFQLTLVTTVLSSLTAYIVWRFVIYVLQTTPGTFLKPYGIHYLTFCWNFVGTYFFSILGTLPFFSPKIFPTSKSSSKK